MNIVDIAFCFSLSSSKERSLSRSENPITAFSGVLSSCDTFAKIHSLPLMLIPHPIKQLQALWTFYLLISAQRSGHAAISEACEPSSAAVKIQGQLYIQITCLPLCKACGWHCGQWQCPCEWEPPLTKFVHGL